jgi:cytosine/adenosine deaminase-related metal-dependent hydrolase
LTATAAWFGRVVVCWPPGAPADFVVVADDTVRTVGSKPGQIAFAATEVEVTDVVVAGRRIVRHGQHHPGPASPMLAGPSTSSGSTDAQHPRHRHRGAGDL